MQRSRAQFIWQIVGVTASQQPSSRTLGTEEHLAVRAAVLLSVLDLDGGQALLDSSRRLVSGQNTLAGGADLALRYINR